MYADASGLEGWSAWTLVDGVVYMASGSWVAGELELVVADKELFASSVGLVTLSPLGSASYVWELTDNMVCLGVMRSNVAASPVALGGSADVGGPCRLVPRAWSVYSGRAHFLAFKRVGGHWFARAVAWWCGGGAPASF